MSTSDLSERLDAVERALTDGEADLTEIRDAAALADDVQRLEQRVADLEATVEELEAAVEAVRGYAGNVRAVNRDVERRASAALAKAEALEAAVDGPTGNGSDRRPSTPQTVQPPQSPSAGEASRAGAGRPDATNGNGGTEHRPSGADADRDEPSGFDFVGGDDRARSATGGQCHHEDCDRQPGPSATGRAGDEDRSGGDAGGATDDEESETEQFIERVRDAL